MAERPVFCKDSDQILSRYTGIPDQLENGIPQIIGNEIKPKDKIRLL
jgi:hypothetical protein